MLEFVLKVIGVFALIYIAWLFSGGVERGELRKEAGRDNLLIGLHKNPDGASTSTQLFNINIK